MRGAVRTVVLALGLALLQACAPADRQADPTSASADEGVGAGLESAFAGTMREHGIAGAQLVHIHAGGVEALSFGVLRAGEAAAVTDRSLFQSASLSKVVAAYVTLRLVDQGVIGLDEPLWDYWPSPRSRDNPLAQRITARQVLNHTTGLVNWEIDPSDPAIDATPLTSLFPPGRQFSYSGEGFLLLQRTLEHVTGLSFEELARREAFARFGMVDSSYLTRPGAAGFTASGHAADGAPRRPSNFARANIAYTLMTNAHEYSRFIQGALLRGEGLAPATHAAMLAEASDGDDLALPSPADPWLNWGLGVGRQLVAERLLLWHWGDNPGHKAFFVLEPATGESLVLFTNSENGLESYKQVLRLFLGGADWPWVDWAKLQS